MIRNIKEEVDVDRVVRGHNNHRVVKVYSSVTCHIFPSPDLTCLEHYMDEASWENGRIGDRKGDKSKKGKPAAPGMSSSLSTNGIPGGNIGHGRGQSLVL